MLRLYLALISLSVLWGLSFVFIKYMLEPAGVWGTVFLRCLAGVIVLLPVLWTKRKQIVRPIPWVSLIVIGIFNAGIPWGFIALSETQLASGTASILNATTPIWSGLLGFLLFSVVLSKRQWLGIIIGFIGILVLMNFNLAQLTGENFIGIGTMIIAALSYGFSSQYIGKYLKNAGVLIITIGTLIVGAIFGFIGTLFTEPIHFSGLAHPAALISLIGLGCLGTGLGQIIYYYLVTKGSPEFATTVTYLIPATALVWGYVLFQESITFNIVLGVLIIMFGVYLSSRKGKKKTVEGNIPVKKLSS